MLAPLIGGWIADTKGFTITFAVSMVLSIIMVAILVLIIKEPRKIQHMNPLPAGEGT
jgi:fucose permease